MSADTERVLFFITVILVVVATTAMITVRAIDAAREPVGVGRFAPRT